MCGIAGLFYQNAQNTPERVQIQAMTDAIAHRGPDGEGFHLEPGLALGHRRLAIIDPEGGHQPMYNSDRSVTIVFNGEIYNFETLRHELEQLGHLFQSRCDTETIIHAWEHFGEACVDHLHGMFAFALWDRRCQKLFCARDRLGKKPFYYTFIEGTFAFGSEIAALAALPGAPQSLRPQAIDDFFAFGYVPEPGTIFENIFRLPPASTLTFARGNTLPRIACYWQPETATRPCTEAAAVLELRRRLTDAVVTRLVADVPLGAFLSGGVDSSAVVATAASARKNPLDTFTIGFEGAEDETPYANVVAERYGTRQHNDRAAATDMIGAARLQARIFGEPFGDSSSVPTHTVCRLARRHATVAISGDGGDEVFGGYRRYRWHSLVSGIRRHIPAGLRREAIGRLAAIYPKFDRAPRFLRGKTTLTELSLDDALAYASTVTRCHAQQRRRLFSTRLRREIEGHDPFAPLASVMTAAEDADPLLQAQLADLQTWLPGDILTKVDRASMAASLEVRAPFLDHEFLAWGLSLPAKLKIGPTGGKHILKRALEPLLPRDVLYRPKQGFATDLAPLFRREMARVKSLLLGAPMLESGLFDANAIAALLDEHATEKFNHAQPIWLLLAFEGFLAALAEVARPDAAKRAA